MSEHTCETAPGVYLACVEFTVYVVDGHDPQISVTYCYFGDMYVECARYVSVMVLDLVAVAGHAFGEQARQLGRHIGNASQMCACLHFEQT